jgi:glutathione S-transferase
MKTENTVPSSNTTKLIKVSAFRWVPPFAQGLVRDLRVRWALQEAGLAYRERLIGFEDQATDSYRALQPFGQVPAYEEDGLVMFESGAIVLHIAEQSEALMPSDAQGQARMKTWMFAALNTIEPPIQMLNEIDMQNRGDEAAKTQRGAFVDLVKKRLSALSDSLDGREYLEQRFTAADLLMTTVLRILRNTDLLSEVPKLDAYRLRCEARPAFQRALAEHMASFEQHTPPKN